VEGKTVLYEFCQFLETQILMLFYWGCKAIIGQTSQCAEGNNLSFHVFKNSSRTKASGISYLFLNKLYRNDCDGNLFHRIVNKLIDLLNAFNSRDIPTYLMFYMHFNNFINKVKLSGYFNLLKETWKLLHNFRML
jgi:hypothetical protein